MKKRLLVCPVLQDPLTCSEKRCGCGWPETPCRGMHPDLHWAYVNRPRYDLFVDTSSTIQREDGI